MRIRSGSIALLSLFLLLGIVNAAAPGCSINNNLSAGLPNPNYGNAIMVTLLALMLSIMVVAIAYIINKIIPVAGIGNWIQNEYWEIAKSAILVGGIYLSLLFLSNVALILNPGNVLNGAQPTGSIGKSVGGLLLGSEGYLGTVCDGLYHVFIGVGQISAGLGLLAGGLNGASFKLGLYLPIVIPLPYINVITFQFGTLFGPYNSWLLQTGNYHIAPYGSTINDLVNFVLFPVAVTDYTLMTLMPALVGIGLGLMIPLGILFRAFPFIRGIGGTVITIGIGMSIVFPSVLILFNYPITNAYINSVPTIQPSTASCPMERVATKIPVIGGVLGSICRIMDTTYNVGNAIGWAWTAFGSIYPFMNAILDFGMFAVLQLLLLVMDVIIMYAILDGLARTLGGSIRLSLGGKLKLAS